MRPRTIAILTACLLSIGFGSFLTTNPASAQAGGDQFCYAGSYCLNAWNGGPEINVYTPGVNKDTGTSNLPISRAVAMATASAITATAARTPGPVSIATAQTGISHGARTSQQSPKTAPAEKRRTTTSIGEDGSHHRQPVSRTATRSTSTMPTNSATAKPSS
jgi:hypothetical protein